MKRKYFAAKDLLYIIPLSLALGAGLASIQSGRWFSGFLSFSFLFLLSFSLLKFFSSWANGGRTLAWIVALAFLLRFGIGVTLQLALPVYGHEDEDDRAGYVFTDAHRRDDQAWKLATSEYPVIDAFSQQYGSDQYGGLLAFNTFVYRYFSPDAQRPLMLVLLSAFFAALGIPFFWKAVNQVFGDKVAWAATWVFALYPDSILLGASAMREPYLLTFNTLVLWGFVHRFYRFEESPSINKLGDVSNLLKDRIGWMWIALGLAGMLLVSPAVALLTIVAFGGWLFFTGERREVSWRGIAAIVVIFILGLFFLSSSLNRSGEFLATSPLHVINDWFQAAVKWDVYQAVRGSGWLQKIFDEGPAWIRLPFIAIYGIFQPVLPAEIIHPTILIWKLIGLTRAIAWYALLPVLTFSFVAAAGQERRPAAGGSVEGSRKMRSLVLWLSLLAWTLILLASLRGGADLFDNPRYRTIFFVWQSILAGYVWVWWRETRNAWLTRILLMEGVFLLVFMQWYISRYYRVGGQLPFGVMVVLILGLWAIILGIGFWRDKRNTPQSGNVDKRSSPADKSRA
ncbi:MAG TPA: hypothetical protein VLE49_08770 [Anaerolineales bacterium]|nr:hypothetical protein [Anaerolineales bacterium]